MEFILKFCHKISGRVPPNICEGKPVEYLLNLRHKIPWHVSKEFCDRKTVEFLLSFRHKCFWRVARNICDGSGPRQSQKKRFFYGAFCGVGMGGLGWVTKQLV